ncbi:DUF6397 family protein [Actinacidiphila guanduensis]|uniref:Uncharacterized protein n=1 Tax=Actinacidiphila guanduensis TaxID=310781 RepID=A0A1H0HVK9_9ACTN|nr:DUF6397 family protein [Actinacidiphila guanduensis]SDO23193.1 hypothetical protein SAMN05216259_108223 [Actinacidiphila guanduensis]
MSTTRQRKQSRRSAVVPARTSAPVKAVEMVSLGQARETLGLGLEEFDLALQLGEVPAVGCGPHTWKVPAGEVERLCAEPGHPQPLLERIRLIGSAEAAKILGVGRERFVRLAKAGFVRPARWYVNRYRALVWLYPAHEVPQLAEEHPALLHRPLPAGLREAVAAGEDQRARGWRSRRVAQLVRDAYDAWEEAAVWAALLGPEALDTAVPDVSERAHLRRLRGTLPPGRTGLATPEQIRKLTTADHPDEITLALFALADALRRARAERPAPAPAAVPAGPDRQGSPGLAPPPIAGTARAHPLAAAGPSGTLFAVPVPAPAPRPAPAAPQTLPTEEVPLPAGPEAPVRTPARAPAHIPARVPAHAAPRPGHGRRLLHLLGRGRRSGRAAPAGRGGHESAGPGHSSPTSVTRTTARPSSSEAARSTSAEMPQP